MTKKNLGWLLAFVLGCATAPVVTSLVQPPHARSQDAQRWEVYCESGRVRSPGAAAEFIMEVGNRAGAEGWELTLSSGVFACFKRPL